MYLYNGQNCFPQSVVTGECEVLYDVSPVPAAILKAQPMLAPLDNGSQPIIQIFKTQNFSNCNQRPVYNFGLEGFEGLKPGANAGSFLSVSIRSYYVRTLRISPLS